MEVAPNLDLHRIYKCVKGDTKQTDFTDMD